MPSSAVIALACLAVAKSSPAETLGVTTVALTQPPPITSPRHDLKIEYEAHVGGLAIGGVAVSATWNGERYAMTSHLITDGLAAKMFRAQFQNASHGLFKGRQVKPEQYSTNYQSITEQRQVKITFDETDTPIVDASPPYEEKYEVTEAQKRGAVDPMSSIMHFIVGSSATSNAPCGRAVPIYDGERRYDIKIKFKKEIEITPKIVDTYQGPGYQCTIQYQEVAGFKPRSVRDKPHPEIKIFVANIESGRYLVPVRINIDTDYGYLVVRASRLDFETAS